MEAVGAKISFPLDLLLEKINEVKAHLPSSYDDAAKILALARPIVEVTFIECGDFEPEARKFPDGKVPISPISIMLIHLIAKLGWVGTYRHACKVLADKKYKWWLHALQLEKAPHHSTLSTFRKKRGPEFFKIFFRKLTAILVAFGLLSGDDAAIVDSAPVSARMNLARANALPRLDLDLLGSFFAAVDFAPVLATWEAARGPQRGRKPKFEALPMIKYLAFEQLGGFLCRTQGPRYLEKHPKAAALLGFPAGAILTDQNIAAFERRSPPLADLLEPVAGQVSKFFDGQHASSDGAPAPRPATDAAHEPLTASETGPAPQLATDAAPEPLTARETGPAPQPASNAAPAPFKKNHSRFSAS